MGKGHLYQRMLVHQRLVAIRFVFFQHCPTLPLLFLCFYIIQSPGRCDPGGLQGQCKAQHSLPALCQMQAVVISINSLLVLVLKCIFRDSFSILLLAVFKPCQNGSAGEGDIIFSAICLEVCVKNIEQKEPQWARVDLAPISTWPRNANRCQRKMRENAAILCINTGFSIARFDCKILQEISWMCRTHA